MCVLMPSAITQHHLAYLQPLLVSGAAGVYTYPCSYSPTTLIRSILYLTANISNFKPYLLLNLRFPELQTKKKPRPIREVKPILWFVYMVNVISPAILINERYKGKCQMASIMLLFALHCIVLRLENCSCVLIKPSLRSKQDV